MLENLEGDTPQMPKHRAHHPAAKTDTCDAGLRKLWDGWPRWAAKNIDRSLDHRDQVRDDGKLESPDGVGAVRARLPISIGSLDGVREAALRITGGQQKNIDACIDHERNVKRSPQLAQLFDQLDLMRDVDQRLSPVSSLRC